MASPNSSLLPTYTRLPVRFARGSGCLLWDEDGTEYLDALSGIAVCALGHCHRDITEALQEQAATLIHTSNLYEITQQQRLADRLTAGADMDHAFFCNSGAEANECALKIARLHAHQKGHDQPKVLVMEGAFHGRTLMTLSASSGARVRDGYAPDDDGFVRVPFNDLRSAQDAMEQHDIAAVLVEPIQGEGGIRIPGADYLPGLRALCDAQDALLILDEVQTGMGRTGALFAYRHTDILPDIVTLAKSLGNGYPIGACLTRGQANGLMSAGRHGTTFGGSPLACRVALTVLDVLERDQLCTRAAQAGEALVNQLRSALGSLPGVIEIRGLGLMIGIELKEPAPDLMTRALDARLLINVTQQRVVRLLPPLVITDPQQTTLVERLVPLIEEVAT